MVRLRTTSHRINTPDYTRGLWLWIWVCLAGSVSATVSAISIAPSQYWEGNDGPWSTFPILVGTPSQNVRVLISTAATSTWVVAPEGCEGSGIPSNCSSTRAGIFNRTASTTWKDNGPWNLGIEANLGTNYAADEGEFGWDTVGLGFQGSGGPSLDNTVVANLQTMDYYVGMLGLNPRPTNFSDFNDPQASYLNLLWLNGHIPSLSYSYTAGAKYRNNGELGSLILGGYDTSLFQTNDVTFSFYSDQSRDLTVGLKSITGSGGQSLLPNGILTFIDSTVPEIWLPTEACAIFESTFGLVYDPETELYLVNDTQHIKLQQQDTSLTFTLSPTLETAAVVLITFPYAAFDLEVEYPIVNGTQRYFPLKRADNSTQYTLGRTFLQEAYLTADYGRSNFSVSQRTWTVDPTSDIVNIIPANETTTSSSTSSNGTALSPGTGSTGTTSKVSTGTVAGAAIGGVAVAAFIGFGIWFMLRSRNRKAEEKKDDAEVAAEVAASEEAKLQDKKDAIAVNEHHAVSSPVAKFENELDTPGHKAPEMYGDSYFSNVEMSAEERRAELAEEERRAELADPHGPVFELEAPHGYGELLSPDEARIRSDGEAMPSPMSSPRSAHTVTTRDELPSQTGTLRSQRTSPMSSRMGSLADVRASPRSEHATVSPRSQVSSPRDDNVAAIISPRTQVGSPQSDFMARIGSPRNQVASPRSQHTATTADSSRPFSWQDEDSNEGRHDTPAWI